jgi:hypothetical protein
MVARRKSPRQFPLLFLQTKFSFMFFLPGKLSLIEAFFSLGASLSKRSRDTYLYEKSSINGYKLIYLAELDGSKNFHWICLTRHTARMCFGIC